MELATSEARIDTSRASRYLGQLCKHFAHKIPVTHTAEEGRIEFPFGVCLLDAQPELLILRAEASDAQALAQVEDVVARHLERFAFRDKPEIRWNRTAA
jgi:uncharacterized protein